MVATKHCCWGECRSDSRYPDKLHPSLKKLLQEGKDVFLPFPKKSQGLVRCQQWVNACGRGEAFTVNNVTKYTYICLLHWPGEAGPTKEYDVPLKATLSAKEVAKASKPKRKAPRERQQQEVQSKRRRPANDNDLLLSLNAEEIRSVEQVSDVGLDELEEPKCVDSATQTCFSKHELALKVEAMMLRNTRTITGNGASSSQSQSQIVSNVSYEIISKDSTLMKHFVGLTSTQFQTLHTFLNDVCPLDKISYWSYAKKSNAKGTTMATRVKKTTSISKWSSHEKLYICLLRLRRGFTIKTMSILLSTPDKQIKQTTIRDIFTTYIQLMYKVFREMEEIMFPPRQLYRRFLPRVFKTMKNVRCIVDCTEFKIETSRDFARQGNTYSQYKHSNTFKCLIAVAPNGGACFVSDLFEGDINDVEIFEECGILKHINPYDIIMVDRGFTVQDLVNPLQARIMIPAFLKGRKHLSAAEELSTRKIAKARIHVERFNQRLKSFKLVGRTIPLSLAPLATQMVVVASCLVNFQEVLCK